MSARAYRESLSYIWYQQLTLISVFCATPAAVCLREVNIEICRSGRVSSVLLFWYRTNHCLLAEGIF